MIVAAAFCPHPPLLVPEAAVGAAAELDPLRAACDEAVRRMLAAAPTSVLVIGAAGPPGGLTRFGVPLPPGHAAAGADGLPLSLVIGRWLLARAGRADGARFVAVSDATALAVPPEPTGLLVMGDGSAKRPPNAPGYADARAEPFDAAVRDAFAAGDTAALAALDPALGAELWAAGVSAWRVAGALLTGTEWTSKVLYDAAPYGVGYLVAAWQPR